MANIKISELTALTPPDAADLVPVTDSSASQTKRTTVGEIVGIINGDVDVANDGTATISELPVSKLQDGDARQLLQTDAAGTGVEWTSNVDVPGTLDVTGAATLDSTLGVTGQSTLASAAISDLTSGRVVLAGTSGELEDSAGLTFNGTQLDVDGDVVIASGKSYRINGTEVLSSTTLGSGVTGSSLTSVGTISSGTWQGTAIDAAYLDSTVVTTGDTGTVTSTMIADGTIVDGDINASAAIAGTKISPDFGSQNVVTTGTSTAASFIPTSSTVPTNGVYLPSANNVAISTSGSEAARIDSFGRLLVGTSTARSNFFNTSTFYPGLQLEGATDQNRLVSIVGSNSGGTGGTIILASQKSGTVGGNTIVSDGGQLGAVSFQGNDGTEFVEAARIQAEVDGTPGANDMPGRLVFFVSADGASSPTEALRISNDRSITVSDGGNIVVGTTTGTKIGTATSQKIGFFDATPVVQPTTGVAEAAFVENSGGTAINVDSTFGGYTLQQVVQALQNLGILA